jgi:hypothetical protein
VYEYYSGTNVGGRARRSGEQKIPDWVAKNVVQELKSKDDCERKYNSLPLRDLDVFERGGYRKRFGIRRPYGREGQGAHVAPSGRAPVPAA